MTARCKFCGSTDAEHLTSDPATIRDASAWCDPWCCAEDAPTVCIAHGRFIPCRKAGEHRYTANPFWVKAVRDYQESPTEDLTWEPAWEATR